MTNNKMTFAEQFKLWRLAKGFNKTEAAQYFGVTTEAVCHWEKGVSQPPDGKILTMCEEMKLNPQLFLKKKTNPFAEELKKRRSELGLTQSELSRELGYCKDSIVSWELGKIPSRIALEDICSYFGMEVEVWEKLLRKNSRS
nr:MAG TPA: Repressor protein CI [Caudoviricetes sp.]